MKQQLYWIVLSISLGIIGVVLLCPSLIDQCCTLLNIPNIPQPDKEKDYFSECSVPVSVDPFPVISSISASNHPEPPFLTDFSVCEGEMCLVSGPPSVGQQTQFNTVADLLEPEYQPEFDQFSWTEDFTQQQALSFPSEPSFADISVQLTEPSVVQIPVELPNFAEITTATTHTDLTNSEVVQAAFNNSPPSFGSDQNFDTEHLNTAAWNTPAFHDTGISPNESTIYQNPAPQIQQVQNQYSTSQIQSEWDQYSIPQTQPIQNQYPVPQTQPIQNQYSIPQTQSVQNQYPVPQTQPAPNQYPTPQTQPIQNQYPAPQTQPIQNQYSPPQTQPVQNLYPNQYPTNVQPRNDLYFEAPGELRSSNEFAPASRLQVESRIVEILPCPGAETIARVGTEVILGCDVLPEVKKLAYFSVNEQLEKMSPEDRAQITEEMVQQQRSALAAQIFPSLLEQQVKMTLLYCDFALGRKKEEIRLQERRFGDLFEEKIVPDLQKKFKARTKMELNETLEREIGSSLDREKSSFIRRILAESWLNNTIHEAGDGECTYEEMQTYYNNHLSDFERKARVRWMQLTVRFSNEMPLEEAQKKISWMGNQIVLQGAPFEEIARKYSDDPRAKDGGLWPWTGHGVLVSQELDQAVFSQPVGVMGPIIQDRNGVHIVKVLEREEQHFIPFIEVQAAIRDKIKEQRRQKKETEYISELYRRYHPEIYQDSVANLQNQAVRVVLPEATGTSLHMR